MQMLQLVTLIPFQYPASFNVLAKIAQTIVTNIVLNVPLTCSMTGNDANYAIPRSMISVRSLILL